MISTTPISSMARESSKVVRREEETEEEKRRRRQREGEMVLKERRILAPSEHVRIRNKRQACRILPPTPCVGAPRIALLRILLTATTTSPPWTTSASSGQVLKSGCGN
uniref:Uncharacterized protein n=1 Tax=Physcomitrium patens TaxID=3218 RepID=A0A2K1IAR5_PHYPA|nr:hypothetical protein PHYPA_030944 [Physcomitrium patens]